MTNPLLCRPNNRKKEEIRRADYESKVDDALPHPPQPQKPKCMHASTAFRYRQGPLFHLCGVGALERLIGRSVTQFRVLKALMGKGCYQHVCSISGWGSEITRVPCTHFDHRHHHHLYSHSQLAHDGVCALFSRVSGCDHFKDTPFFNIDSCAFNRPVPPWTFDLLGPQELSWAEPTLHRDTHNETWAWSRIRLKKTDHRSIHSTVSRSFFYLSCHDNELYTYLGSHMSKYKSSTKRWIFFFCRLISPYMSLSTNRIK